MTLFVSWSREHASQMADAYVPLTFAPGEAYQFDWSHEIVVMNGVTTIVKVAHVRLCHSRMMFVRAYPRETQEMVFDDHERAFSFFKGACTWACAAFVALARKRSTKDWRCLRWSSCFFFCLSWTEG
jgi:hypothetical protein